MAEARTRPPQFEQVAAELSGPLERYLRRFVGDAHLAEDLRQETLLRISKGLSDFEGRASLKTWAFKIATRTAIDHLRRSSGGFRVAEVEEAEALPDDVEDVGERLVIEEMGSCVRAEIDRLPGDYRAAIILHDLEGLTASETAQILGCTITTAKIRIHRARARLRNALEEDCRFYRDRDQVLRCDLKPPEGDDPPPTG